MIKIYSLIAGIFLINVTQAQSIVGLRIGTNLATVTTNTSERKTSFKFGETAGIYTTINLTDKFLIQPELLYSSEGYKRTETVDELRISYNIRSNYLNLPVLAKYKLVNGLTFELGPQISYLMGGYVKYKYYYIDENNVIIQGGEKVKLKDDSTRSFEFAGVIGVGYELKGGYSFNARFTQGITNFIHYDFANLKNQFFSFTVGIPILKY
jgi:hypothetical protein